MPGRTFSHCHPTRPRAAKITGRHRLDRCPHAQHCGNPAADSRPGNPPASGPRTTPPGSRCPPFRPARPSARGAGTRGAEWDRLSLRLVTKRGAWWLPGVGVILVGCDSVRRPGERAAGLAGRFRRGRQVAGQWPCGDGRGIANARDGFVYDAGGLDLASVLAAAAPGTADHRAAGRAGVASWSGRTGPGRRRGGQRHRREGDDPLRAGLRQAAAPGAGQLPRHHRRHRPAWPTRPTSTLMCGRRRRSPYPPRLHCEHARSCGLLPPGRAYASPVSHASIAHVTTALRQVVTVSSIVAVAT
jgi:hypothetical protein